MTDSGAQIASLRICKSCKSVRPGLGMHSAPAVAVHGVPGSLPRLASILFHPVLPEAAGHSTVCDACRSPLLRCQTHTTAQSDAITLHHGHAHSGHRLSASQCDSGWVQVQKPVCDVEKLVGAQAEWQESIHHSGGAGTAGQDGRKQGPWRVIIRGAGCNGEGTAVARVCQHASLSGGLNGKEWQLLGGQATGNRDSST